VLGAPRTSPSSGVIAMMLNPRLPNACTAENGCTARCASTLSRTSADVAAGVLIFRILRDTEVFPVARDALLDITAQKSVVTQTRVANPGKITRSRNLTWFLPLRVGRILASY